MKNILLSFFILTNLITLSSCAALNSARGELHYNFNVTKGQELLDLKKALDEGAITKDEFELMKKKIINDEYVKEIIKSTKKEIKEVVI